jgi:hypothetical protein
MPRGVLHHGAASHSHRVRGARARETTDSKRVGKPEGGDWGGARAGAEEKSSQDGAGEDVGINQT